MTKYRASNNPISIDNLHDRLIFDPGKKKDIPKKEHNEISKNAKFGGKILKSVRNIAL